MRLIFWLVIVAMFLGACGTTDPFREPPATCQGIDEERAQLNDRIAGVTRARTAKLALAYGLAGCVVLGPCAPAFAAAPPILETISIDLSPTRSRSEFLALARLARNCPPAK